MPGIGDTDPGPRDPVGDQQNPDLINPPSTDHGTLPNLRFSFADSRVRQESGGWTRQITERELGVSKGIAGVNIRLNAGGIRELHRHKEAEWAHMLYGTTRITAIDEAGAHPAGSAEGPSEPRPATHPGAAQAERSHRIRVALPPPAMSRRNLDLCRSG